MAGRKKRKFNWDELSSEEDEIETKKVVKKQDKKAVEEQAKKLDQLTMKTKSKVSPNKSKDESQNKETTMETTDDTSTRSTRGRKRAFDEIDHQTNKTVTRLKVEEEPVKRDTKTTRSTVKEEPKQEIRTTAKEQAKTKSKFTPTIDDESPPKSKNAKIKNEFVTPTKNSIESKAIIKTELSSNENTDAQVLNILPDKHAIRASDAGSQPDNADFNLPIINVKSIKMKLLKKEDVCKRFSKKHLSPSISPTKTKFTEIKIQLNDEQRDWFNKQIQKYDGEYDKEFDTE